MEAKHLVANFPSLYSHKGTPVRLFFELQVGAPFIVEPLRYGAGGVSINADVTNTYLVDKTVKVSSISILGHEGNVIKEVDLPQSLIISISAFVIYPDGATWEGRIFEGAEDRLGLLVWSWELGRRLKVENSANLFGANLSWPDVPTTIGFFKNEVLAGCSTREHPCPTQCHRITKAI